ncbi:hypothetical protein V6N12_041479 [Hibiscus sabdariffa]|uniref:Uncharacterized protein n=1 Tax=Hibiscus sabdariffa TaxID=183260 RepID=A0ABR2B245_9ROSI
MSNATKNYVLSLLDSNMLIVASVETPTAHRSCDMLRQMSLMMSAWVKCHIPIGHQSDGMVFVLDMSRSSTKSHFHSSHIGSIPKRSGSEGRAKGGEFEEESTIGVYARAALHDESSGDKGDEVEYFLALQTGFAWLLGFQPRYA